MLGDRRGVEKSQREKGRKKQKPSKYGQAKLKHSRKGIRSCWYSGVALALLLFSLISTFLHQGATYPVAAGLVFIAAILAILGLRAAVKGMWEREKNYLTCKIGIVADVVILFLILIIYLSGR